MDARDLESNMLDRCAEVAGSGRPVADDAREANVFRLAAMVIWPRFPEEADRLMQASDGYFSRHPHEQVESADVVRNGWVSSLPRLRDMLSRKLHERCV